MVRVHPTAIVERHAELGVDVVIGPFCHVHAGARIGDRTELVSHVVVRGTAHVGTENRVHPFAVLGGEAQLQRPAGVGALVMGDGNVVRESVTLNAASEGGVTRVGSHNLFMAGCHVAHDVRVGDHCVVANAVQIAGHATIGDGATFGGLSGVAQYVKVGDIAFVAAGAMCERDVPPFVIVQGDRARPRAINAVGLERRGVRKESIRALRVAFARIWGADGFELGLARVDRTDAFVAELTRWLEDPERVRPRRRPESSRTRP
jgi:UDP-N-acetylglucosamine acyltransferase